MLVVFSVSVPLSAETRTWVNDAGDNDWFNPLNWSPEGEPAHIDELLVHSGQPTASEDVYGGKC